MVGSGEVLHFSRQFAFDLLNARQAETASPPASSNTCRPKKATLRIRTTVSAPVDSIITEILVKKGFQVDSDDLLVLME